jgi:hypothetical protein
MKTKICIQCKKEKNVDDFYNRHLKCKECCIIRAGEWAKQHPILRQRYSEKYKDNNLEKYKQSQHEHYLRNKDKFNENAKRWGKKNRKHINEKIKQRMKDDICFKLSYILRGRIRGALNFKRIKKCNRTVDLIGCSAKELKLFLESKFQNGMNWKNYGFNGWHIDHIIPCSKFDLSKIEEQKKCFHYSNLQPLWAKDNLIKHNKIL